MLESLIPHIKPFQKPHPPIGVAGVSAGSETLKVAGERGFLPMSLNLNQTYVASHWASVEEGARRTGRTPSRADWRLVREIFVADTDEEAWRLSVGAQMGRMMREYFLPLLKNVGVIQYLKHDDAVADSDVTPEYCARHNWLIGSPAHGGREDRAHVRRGRRLRPPAAVLLRLQREPACVAALDGIAGQGGHAEGRAFAAAIEDSPVIASPRAQPPAGPGDKLRDAISRCSIGYTRQDIFGRRPHLRRVIGLARGLDETVKTAREQNFLKPIVEHMAR